MSCVRLHMVRRHAMTREEVDRVTNKRHKSSGRCKRGHSGVTIGDGETGGPASAAAAAAAAASTAAGSTSGAVTGSAATSVSGGF